MLPAALQPLGYDADFALVVVFSVAVFPLVAEPYLMRLLLKQSQPALDFADVTFAQLLLAILPVRVILQQRTHHVQEVLVASLEWIVGAERHVGLARLITRTRRRQHVMVETRLSASTSDAEEVFSRRFPNITQVLVVLNAHNVLEV